jgi:enoyl-CoA hydratase
MSPVESAAESILIESVGATRVVTLNRPDKLNVADLEMQERFLACLRTVAADSEARALVLTGAGRAFSAGGDRKYVEEIIAGRLEAKVALRRTHFATAEAMISLAIPAVAAVNGPAVGFGAGLVAMCDFVVMGEGAFLCDPHVTFGVEATTGCAIVWPRLTSPTIAKDILMTGRRVAAKEAVELGLASRLCPAGEELATALEIAERYHALPPTGVAAPKRAFTRPLLAELAAYGDPDGEDLNF